jgi:hypothetical protein
MNLPNPVTFTPPSITKKDGTVKTFNPITLNKLSLRIMDSVDAKVVMVSIHPIPRPLVLWTGADYDAAGDYTQAMVEARVLELLGNDPSATLSSLFNR